MHQLRSNRIFDETLRSAETCHSNSGRMFSVLSPSTCELLARLPDMGEAETRMAIEAAAAAQAAWAGMTATARSEILLRWSELVLKHGDELAAILTAEMGKPLQEAKTELTQATTYIRWYAEEAKRIYGENFPAPTNDRRMMVIKQPVGVVGAITPWNFPASTVTRKVAPALAAGCTVVLKPADQTPLTAGALLYLAEQAGLPNGVMNLIYTTDADAVGRELTSNLAIRKISFTGSLEVGRLIMSRCASSIKKLSLELGNSAPFIVFPDADMDKALDGVMQAKFRNAGQSCVAAGRIYVHDAIHDTFAQNLAARARELRLGDGFDPSVDIGPIIDLQGLRKIEEHVADAVTLGARTLCGGRAPARRGHFYEPTVLTQVTPKMKIAREESFGPLAPIIRFESDDEALQAANDTIFGLAAYFYSENIKRIWSLSEALEYGVIGINTGRMSSEAAPIGGLKQSGLGKEGSRHGLESYLDSKFICIGGLS
ncbi:NAD-dependent succinate-semialdehyde dehydrogenase [Methylorubrum rhodesianum]|uniref:NAD-dependent succinate-semialdehyde dehydrogenase n=1 Tax=Methylorubrum rhodesianum TaxID=29427 RepID=UPI003D03E4B1